MPPNQTDPPGTRFLVFICETCGKPDQEHGDVCLCDVPKRLRSLSVVPAQSYDDLKRKRDDLERQRDRDYKRFREAKAGVIAADSARVKAEQALALGAEGYDKHADPARAELQTGHNVSGPPGAHPCRVAVWGGPAVERGSYGARD